MRLRDLSVGDVIRVRRTFHDFDGTEHPAGTRLTLEAREYFPYDAGHTFRFVEGAVIRVSENDPASAPLLDAGDLIDRADPHC